MFFPTSFPLMVVFFFLHLGLPASLQRDEKLSTANWKTLQSRPNKPSFNDLETGLSTLEETFGTSQVQVPSKAGRQSRTWNELSSNAVQLRRVKKTGEPARRR